MAQSRFELVFLDGKRAGESVPLEGAEVTLGRSRSSTIVLDDPLVSRHHLRLALTGNAVMLHDLDSSHGTFLNNKRVRGSVSLNPGDVLQVGDTKLRFSAPENTDADKTAFVDVDASDASKSSATHFADASSAGGLSETGFMPVEEPPPEDPGDKTMVFAAGETRILDDAELKGLRAAVSAAAPRRKKKTIAAATLIVLAVVAAVAVFTRSPQSADESGQGASAGYTDQEYGFSINCPSGWKRTTGTEGALLQYSLKNARITVYADKSTAYGYTGLRTGFENYADTLAARHEGMNLDGSKVMQVNNAQTVFYSFTAPAGKGKGIFLLSGDKRICVECSAPKADYEAFTPQFSTALKRFKLTKSQECIDFPPPDATLRRAALASPAQVEATAKRDFDIGAELLKNQGVKPENLYLAVVTLKTCLTTASALGTPPVFYAEAAKTLADAQRNLAAALRDQKLQIVLAERRNDRDGAYWEAVKLTQIIPDKNNENYQYAAKCMKAYANKVKK